MTEAKKSDPAASGGAAGPLLVSRQGPVTVLTLNRPDSRNAINRAMRKALKKELWTAAGDDDVRVVVLTGSGTSFSSGVDLPEALEGPPPRVEGATPTQVLRSIGKPVIAAVNGPCYTGGYELAVNCSFIIASERAEFADTHAQIGLLNGWGGSAMLPRMIGLPAAIQFILSGEPVDGATAARIGIANEVVPHDQLMARTLDVARRIADGHPGAVQRMLRLLNDGAGATLSHALALESEASVSFRPSGSDIGARFEKRRAPGADRQPRG